MAEKEDVIVRPFEVESVAEATEFEEDAEGLEMRVKEPTAVLVTLADKDTDGE